MRQLYPPVCVLCGTVGNAKRDLCAACEADLYINHHACRLCALPLQGEMQSGMCGHCLQKKPKYDSCWSPFLYAQPLEWMIHQFKFNAKLALGTLLADLALNHVPDWLEKPDCIIPVPLHPKRLRERGFNQSQQLAHRIGRNMHLEVDTASCSRTVYTEPQTGKDAKQRKRNIKGAFVFDNRRQYHHVAIFDDVVTTGSTVSELARIIKKAGVERVDVWSIARADKN